MNGFSPLEALARSHQTDKLEHGYCEFYERHFEHLRTRALNLLEIGVLEGGSLKMWADWLPAAQVYGVDKKLYSHVIHPRVGVTICDVADYDPPCNFDVIIDDASHEPAQIVNAYRRLWPYLNPGGFYVIEDLETQFPGPGEALELLDECWRDAVHEWPEEVSEVHFYRQIAFIQRRP